MKITLNFELFNPCWTRAMALAVLLLTAPFAATADCRQWTHLDPYTGYTATGYKGGLERDPVWFRYVRPLEQAGTTRYLLRQAPRSRQNLVYDSIEPIALGGGVYGFMAYTAGCGSLLDRTGAKIIDDVFGALEDPFGYAVDSKGRPLTSAVRTWRLGNWESGNGRYSLVQFQKGKLLARAPHWYDDIGLSGAWESVDGRDSSLQHRLITPGLQAVSINRHSTAPLYGVLRMADLTELLPLQYDAVGNLHTARAKRGGQFIYARSGKEVAVFDLQGRPIATPAFQRFEEYQDNTANEPHSYVALVNDRNQTCRLYTTPMRPLIDDDLPLVSGKCPDFNSNDKHLRYTDAAGWLHTYQFNRDASVARVGKALWGQLAVTLNKALIMRTGNPAAPVYRIVDLLGNDLTAAEFTEMNYLGCGFVRLKRGDTWYSVGQDGTLDTRMYFPFSC